MFCIPVHRCPSSPLPPSPLKGGGIRRQIVNRFRSTERTGRSVGIMIMEGSRDTEDGMSRTSTERLLQQQIQTLVPRLAELVEDYQNRFANPYIAAERGYLDDVIEPRETRPALIRALRLARGKRQTLPPRKHGNIPL